MILQPEVFRSRHKDGWTAMETCIVMGRHHRCPLCRQQIEMAHAEALVEEMLNRLGPDETIPTVDAIIAAEQATESEPCGFELAD